MAEIREFAHAFSWPVSRLADCFGLHRQTLTKRIKEAGLAPSGEHRGNPTYAIADIARIVHAPIDAPAGGIDLDTLPEQRKAWYQSENERIKFETAVQKLIPDHVYVREMSLFAKNVASVLDSVCDVLERDAGVEPSALDQVERAIDSLREQLYEKVVEAESPSDE